MSERRHSWYLLAALALLLAPLVVAVRPALAAGAYTVDKLTDDPYVLGQTYCNPSGLPDCSLRQALQLAEHDGIVSSISFKTGLTGVINLDVANNGALTLTEGNTTIEALINPPAITQPPIEINGIVGGTPSSEPAFTITSSGNTIKGLSITGFNGLLQPQGAGILISGPNASGNTISGNYIGVKTDGTTVGSNVYGIRIAASGQLGNVISGNIIVGSQISGVLIENSSGNTFTSNLIGIGLNSAVLPNAEAGIEVVSGSGTTSTNNTIGGLRSAANFISSNGANGSTIKAGILLRGSGTTGNTIGSNLIGTDIDGTADLGNHGDGIRISSGAHNNTIIGTTEDPVIISGNSGYGIRITGSTTSNNQIAGGTFIGLNGNRNAALANDFGGLIIDQGANGTTLNGSQTALTLIGGNAGPGVVVSGSTTARNQITNAYIGAIPNPTAAGTITVANGGGVFVDTGAQKTTISGNTISGNNNFGVRLSATKTVTITGNFIGLDTARTGTAFNDGPGIDVQDFSNNTLIGGSAGANYLAGNHGAAIAIAGTHTLSTTVSSNIIGLAKDGTVNYTVAAGNTGDGVLISGGPRETTVVDNTITGSSKAGVTISGSDTMTTTLRTNNIGWTMLNDASLPRPNITGGVVINQARYVTAESNVIAYNGGSGIKATGIQTVTLHANRIYYHSAGSGVEINGPSSNIEALDNYLQFNLNYGVHVLGNSQRVRIQSNHMSQNTAGGVKLDLTTRYIDSGTDDSTSLPNHGIDPPIIDPAYIKPLSLIVDQNGRYEGWVYTNTATLPSSSCSPVLTCQIQFFGPDTSAAANGQGYTPYQVIADVGSDPTTFATPKDGSGHFTGQLSLPDGVLPSQLMFAVTDAQGNTSEFGVLDLTPSFSFSYLSPGAGQQIAAPGDKITYTLSLVNNGTVKFTNARFTTAASLDRWAVLPLNGRPLLFNLPAKSTRTLTVTMTLPTGTDANVRVGVQDYTRVTASVIGKINTLSSSRILTTTVRGVPVVSATSLVSSGTAPPSGRVTLRHQFSNSGNITVTLHLVGKTPDPAHSTIWDPVLSTNTLEVPPGQSRTVDAVVTVPSGTPTVDAQGKPVRMSTVITATAQGTVQNPFSVQKVVTGTVGVDLVRGALMSTNTLPVAAEAFAEVPFYHNIDNLSNGPADFCLSSRSRSGSSVVTFTSQNGVPITNNCFHLGMTPSATDQLRVLVLVRVTGKLLPGRLDYIDVYLTDPVTGHEIANTSVTDVVEVTASPMLPAVWLPLTIL